VAPSAGPSTIKAAPGRHAINCPVGIRMPRAVVVFGLATAVFAVPRSDPTSAVQLATPYAMRGPRRCSEFLIIDASSQLGKLGSGGTVALALLWMRLFPTPRNVERLE
jgi:hypothetical protein